MKRSLLVSAISATMLRPMSFDGSDPAPTIEELTAKLAAAEDSVNKLTAKNTEVLEKNRQFGESLKQWDGLDPAQVRSLLEKINGDEELKLIAEGKYEDVIKKRTEKVELGYKTQLTQTQAERDDFKTKYEASSNTIRDLLIDSKVVTTFLAESGLETATPDVVARAKQVFKVENGEVIPRDDKGEIIAGKDGAMTIKEWVNKLKENAAHLFPGSTGTGANGRNGDNRVVTGIEAKIAAAAAAGDQNEYRRLRNVQREQKNKKE